MRTSQLLPLLGLAACQGSGAAPPPLLVAAAADLALAFPELARSAPPEVGAVRFSFGSTGLLAQQLAQGAPFHVFAAANVSFVDQVVAAGACAGESKTRYALGRIAYWSPDQEHLLQRAADLRDPRFKRIALANPEHAPYGRAAREALTAAGLWAELQPRLVFAENVQQALQYVQSGNAEVGLVALSLAAGAGGHYRLVEPELYTPLEQAMVRCGHGPELEARAAAFVEHVNSPAGRQVMRRFGFLLPGEALVSVK